MRKYWGETEEMGRNGGKEKKEMGGDGKDSARDGRETLEGRRMEGSEREREGRRAGKRECTEAV